jgi:hypothetical protein
MPLVALDFRIVQLATNQTLSVKNSVFWVGVEGVLGGIADTTQVNEPSEHGTRRSDEKQGSQSLFIGEGDP